MALDYSKLSDQELEAIANDDYASLSDATLNALASEGQPKEKSMGEKAATAAGGVAGMAVDAATGAWNAIPYKELVVPYAGYKMIPKAIEGVKSGAQSMRTLMTPTGPVAPTTVNPAVSPSYAAPSPVAQQANLFQKGMETAAKMREMAAQFATQNASKMLKGGIGASAALYSPSLNPNEDEELRRRRQMGFQGQ